MSSEDSRYEIASGSMGTDEDDEGSNSGLSTEIRGLWRDLKLFLRKALRLGDMIGNMAVDVHRLIVKAAGLFARFGGLAAALGVAVGLTSPLFDGWGVDALSKSTLATWAPVGAFAVVFFGVRTVLKLFGVVDREGEREQQRQAEKQPHTGLGERLQLNAGRRRVVNESLNGNTPTAPLDDQGFVSDVLAEACYQLGVRGQAGVALTLRRWTPKRGLKEVATRGAIDDIVNGRLNGIGWEDLVDIERALRRALAPFEYAHAALAFTAGRHHYVLIGLSGSSMPDHVYLEISHAATRLVELHANGGKAAEGDGSP